MFCLSLEIILFSLLKEQISQIKKKKFKQIVKMADYTSKIEYFTNKMSKYKKKKKVFFKI